MRPRPAARDCDAISHQSRMRARGPSAHRPAASRPPDPAPGPDVLGVQGSSRPAVQAADRGKRSRRAACGQGGCVTPHRQKSGISGGFHARGQIVVGVGPLSAERGQALIDQKSGLRGRLLTRARQTGARSGDRQCPQGGGWRPATPPRTRLRPGAGYPAFRQSVPSRSRPWLQAVPSGSCRHRMWLAARGGPGGCASAMPSAVGKRT
jgi:hypothetical protein